MASTFTDLGLEIMATGENAGTWGDKTNTNLNIVNTAIAGYVEQSIAGGAATTTLTITDGAATSVAQNAVIKLTGSITGNQIVTIPNSIEKVYIITNGTSGAFTVQVKTVSGTGVTFGVSEKTTKLLYSDGTNIVDAGFSGAGDLDGNELVLDADGDTSLTADTDDQIDIKIAGEDDFRFTANTFTALSGSGVVIPDSGLTLGSTVVTSTAAELNLLDGVSALLTAGSGSITSGFGAIDNGTSGIRTNTFTAETSFVPDAQDGAALGTSSLQFSDLFLADGGVISFGDDNEITLTHVADDGLVLKHVGTGDGKEPSFTFQAGDNDIAADDILGSINFQAPDEGAGTDAILVAAGIEAVSEGDFSSSSNATKLSFKTAASAAAAETASLSSTGVFTATSFTGSGAGLTAGTTPLTTIDIDGGTDIGAAIVDADLFVVDDGASGTNRKTTAARMKTYFTGSITATDIAADDISVGDAAVTLSTSSGNITIDATANDTDIIFKGTDNSSDITMLTLDGSAAGAAAFNSTITGTSITASTSFLPDAQDGAALGTTSLQFSDLFLADAAVIGLGDDNEVTLTHVADTGVLLNSTNVIQFRDSAINIGSPADGDLDINADDEIELNSTLIDINGNVEISGTATTTGVHTFTAVPVFPNNTVETADIQADAITGAKIADDAINSEHYTDGSIDTAHIADNQITLAKLAGGTDGNIISFDASGDPVAVVTGSSGQILTSAGAGAPPTFADAAGGGITQADMFRLTADLGADTDPISSNLERVDDASFGRIGTGMSVSSGIFSFPETGIYEITFFINGTANSGIFDGEIYVTQDNSSYDLVAVSRIGMQENRQVNGVATAFVDVTNLTNDKCKFACSSMSSTDDFLSGSTTFNETFFRFVRLGDT
jgi:hypothetical protein